MEILMVSPDRNSGDTDSSRGFSAAAAANGLLWRASWHI